MMSNNPFAYLVWRGRPWERFLVGWMASILIGLMVALADGGLEDAVGWAVATGTLTAAIWNAWELGGIWLRTRPELRLSGTDPTEVILPGLLLTLAQVIPLALVGAMFWWPSFAAVPLGSVAYLTLLMWRVGRWPWWVPAGMAALLHWAWLPLVWLVSVSYRACVTALRSSVETTPAATRSWTSNPWLRARSENPIVVRETFRESRRCGRSRFQLLASRHGGTALIALSLFSGAALPEPEPASLQVYAMVTLGVLIPLQWFRAACRTGGLLAEERTQGTWQELALSGLSPVALLDGAARVGYRFRLRESLVLALLLAGALLGGAVWAHDLDMNAAFYYYGDAAAAALGACFSLCLAPLSGAYLGAAAGACLDQPAGAILLCLLGSSVAGLIFSCVLGWLGLPLMLAAFALLGRSVALARFSH